MKGQKPIINEVKKKALAGEREKEQNTGSLTQRRNADVLKGLYSLTTPYTMGGTQYPVDVEDMYIYCDERDEFYNETAAKVAQSILGAEQIKEA